MNLFRDNNICCYELDYHNKEINQEFIDAHQWGCENLDKLTRLPTGGHDVSLVFPYVLLKAQGFDNICNFIDSLNGWVYPFVRIFSLDTNNEFMAHVDSNVHGLFEDIPKGHIISASINFTAIPSTDKTIWYRQSGKGFVHPWDVYYGKDVPLDVIDEFVVSNKPALLRIGQWHSISNSSTTSNRIVASFLFNYTIPWDTAVNLLVKENMLLPRY